MLETPFSARFGRTLRRLISASALLVLVSCGGGGGGGGGGTSSGGSSANGITVVQGTIASGVIVVPDSTASSASITISSTDSGKLEISNPTGVLASAKSGQIVYLPANDAQGIPLGYTGKVEKTADGKTLLAPAVLGDMFNSLKVDFDSARDGGQIAGLIVPKNGTMKANISPPASTQSGLDFTSCLIAGGLKVVNNIKCKDGALEGAITLEHPLMVNKKGSTDKVAAKLYAALDFKKLSTHIVVDYDKEKYASTGGINVLSAQITGQWGASLGIKIDDATAKAEIPAWSELIRSDSANIWDENTKIKFSKYFELSGLNGDDKKGLIPLGGIYITPANAAIGGVPFVGELSALQLGQIKALGVVLWVYVDMAGKLSISGDMKALDVNGGSFDKGFKLERLDEKTLKNTIIDTKTPPNVYAPRIVGSIENEQNVGVALAADILVGGIRPATVKAELLGFKVTSKVQGEGGYKWFPAPAGFEGSLCFNSDQEIYSDIQAKVAINAKIDVAWIESSAGYERTFGPLLRN